MSCFNHDRLGRKYTTVSKEKGIKQIGTEWQCEVCGKTFMRLENALAHYFKKHKKKEG